MAEPPAGGPVLGHGGVGDGLPVSSPRTLGPPGRWLRSPIRRRSLRQNANAVSRRRVNCEGSRTRGTGSSNPSPSSGESRANLKTTSTFRCGVARPSLSARARQRHDDAAAFATEVTLTGAFRSRHRTIWDRRSAPLATSAEPRQAPPLQLVLVASLSAYRTQHGFAAPALLHRELFDGHRRCHWPGCAQECRW
jgi:hypothetical protein